MFDAFLAGWHISPVANDRFALIGNVYGRKPFTDGEVVHTSYVVNFEHSEEGTIAVTYSGSRYLLCALPPKDIS